MNPDHAKIQSMIVGQPLLEKLAAQLIGTIHYEVAEAVEAVALKRCEEQGITDPDSDEAMHIADSIERIFTAAVLRHMTNINNHAGVIDAS